MLEYPILFSHLLHIYLITFISVLSVLFHWLTSLFLNLYQFSSVAQSCLTLCNPMDWSTPGLPVHHQFPEFTQTHVHWVGNVIQPSHPLLSSYPAFILPSIKIFSNKSVLRITWPNYWSFHLQHQYLINIQDWFPLGWTGWISLRSKGLSRVFSNTTVQKHQFFIAQLSLWSNSHIHIWLLGKLQPWLNGPLLAK